MNDITCKIDRTLFGHDLSLTAIWAGKDLLIFVRGGSSPHIGGMAIALPYHSNGTPSASLSSISVPGHKDDVTCRNLAKRIAVGLKCETVVVGGVHYDNISKEQIEAIIETMDSIADELIQSLAKRRPQSDASP